MPVKPSCTIFWDENFDGHIAGFIDSIPDLRGVPGKWPGSNFNDEASSIIVSAGTWRFYEHVQYQGLVTELGPGRYANMIIAKFMDNAVSSILKVSDEPQPDPALAQEIASILGRRGL
ncbi:beta/gamma crystallin-related protein [Dongia sp. agr-C8]